MATPVSDSYSAASGATLYGGRVGVPLPSWVPAPGQFVDIGLNTLNSIRPSGWPSGETAGPVINYCGGIYSKDFSSLGALTLYGSGHLVGPTEPLWCGVWHFNLATRLWEGSNIPPAPMTDLEGYAEYNQYGESHKSPNEGHTATPHTYGGLVYQPATSGLPKGALWQTGYPGDGNKKNTVHRFDISSTTAPAVRMIDELPMGGGSSSYPMAASDPARNGMWVSTYDGVGSLKFVSFADGSYTDYSMGYSAAGNNVLIYIPAPYDCLVGMGQFPAAPGTGDYDNYVAGDKLLSMGIHVCPIVGGVPQGFTKVTTSGSPPAEGRCGAVWSTILNCLVSYESHDSYRVHRLTPPTPANKTTGTWVWTNETLTGAGGAVPCGTAYNTNSMSNFPDNGSFSKFIEVPKARCFIWTGSVEKVVQAWRLTGM